MDGFGLQSINHVAASAACLVSHFHHHITATETKTTSELARAQVGAALPNEMESCLWYVSASTCAEKVKMHFCHTQHSPNYQVHVPSKWLMTAGVLWKDLIPVLCSLKCAEASLGSWWWGGGNKLNSNILMWAVLLFHWRIITFPIWKPTILSTSLFFSLSTIWWEISCFSSKCSS